MLAKRGDGLLDGDAMGATVAPPSDGSDGKKGKVVGRGGGGRKRKNGKVGGGARAADATGGDGPAYWLDERDALTIVPGGSGGESVDVSGDGGNDGCEVGGDPAYTARRCSPRC